MLNRGKFFVVREEFRAPWIVGLFDGFEVFDFAALIAVDGNYLVGVDGPRAASMCQNEVVADLR